MDFPIQINAIRIGLSIIYFKGSWVRISKLCCISVPEDCYDIAKSVDPDEMQHSAAFHLDLHCLPKYPFRGFQHTKG